MVQCEGEFTRAEEKGLCFLWLKQAIQKAEVILYVGNVMAPFPTNFQLHPKVKAVMHQYDNYFCTFVYFYCY